MYRSISEDIPVDYYTIPIGKAKIANLGEDVSVITYGMGVHWVKDVIEKNPNISIELIDLRSLLPWDKTTVFESVKKTGKALILHEDTLTGGIGAEIAAQIAEHCFEYLDAPVMRCGALDTPVPFAKNLENNFLPKNILNEKLNQLVYF